MQQTLQKAYDWALEEIGKFWIPPKRLLDISVEKGQEIAEHHGVNKDIVKLGTILMDVKLWEAKQEGRQTDHAEISAIAAGAFLKLNETPDHEVDTVLHAIREHHNIDWFSSLVAEVVANADCYRFASVEWNLYFVSSLLKEWLSQEEALVFGKAKFEEKISILSLDYCKKNLEKDIIFLEKMYQNI